MDIKSLAITLFYNTIRQTVDNFVQGSGFGLAGADTTDLILLAIGYWKKDTWWGMGLLYWAVASLGRDLVNLNLFAGMGKATASSSTPSLPYPNLRV